MPMPVPPAFPRSPGAGARSLPETEARSTPLDSRQLLQGKVEVLIRHGRETYRLRHTRQGKLILTK